MPRATSIPKETIVIDLNKQRPDGEWEYAGYTLKEAVDAAVTNGSYEAWDWLKAWYWADLTRADTTPESW